MLKDTMLERYRKVAEIWVQNPNLSYPKVAEKGGISEVTFWRYRQDPAFMKIYHDICNKRFQGLEAAAIDGIRKAMEEGNFQAIKYILDGLGYKATEKVEAQVAADQNINITIEE